MKFFAIAGVAVSVLSAVALSTPADAQQWPARSVRLIVPYPAGGPNDVLARMVGGKLSEAWGHPVVIDNRPGAGGNIAHHHVAEAPADGTVILLGSIGPLSIAPHLMKLP